MIDLFASEVARPAIFLPEQVEVLAHGGFLGYCFVLLFFQIFAPQSLLERETLYIIDRR